MNDLQDALTGALNAAAHEDEVHIERLLTGARAAGLRYRRRRRILLASSTALAALGPVVLVAAGLALYHHPGRSIESVAGPSPAVTQAPVPTPTTEASRAARAPQLPVLIGAAPAQKAVSTVGRGS